MDWAVQEAFPAAEKESHPGCDESGRQRWVEGSGGVRGKRKQSAPSLPVLPGAGRAPPALG